MIMHRFWIRATIVAFFPAACTLHAQQEARRISEKTPALSTFTDTADKSVKSEQKTIAKGAAAIFTAWPEYLPDPSAQEAKCTGERCFEFPAPTAPELNNFIEKFYNDLLPESGEGKESKASLINHIKSFYFYLEYCTKLEKAAKLITHAFNKKRDTATIKTLISKPNQAGKKVGGWHALLANVGTLADIAKVIPDQDAWDTLLYSFDDKDPLLKITCVQEMGENFKDTGHFWKNLTETTFWQALTVTQEDMKNSSFWQDYIKNLMVNLLSSMGNLPCDEQKTKETSGLLTARLQSAEAIFPYLPYLESAYYMPDFIEHRCQLELMQISLLLGERTLENLHAQSDWKDVPIIQEKFTLTCPKKNQSFQSEKNAPDVLSKAVAFKHDAFFVTLQNLSQKKDQNFENITKLAVPYKQKFNLISMANALQILLQDLFNEKQRAHTIKVLQAESKNMPQPSLLFYTAEDDIYLEDFNEITKEIREAAAKEDNQNVQAAGFFPHDNKDLFDADNQAIIAQGFFGDIGNFFKETGESAFASIKDAANIVKDEGELLACQAGIARAWMSGAEITKRKEELLGLMKNNFSAFQTNIKAVMENVGKAYSYTIPITPTLKALGAIINDPNLKMIGDDWEKFVETTAGAIADAAVTGATGMLTGTVMLSANAIASIAGIISATISGENVGTVFAEFTKDVAASMLEAMSITISSAKKTIGDIMKSIGYLIKLLTDAIIEVGEFTFVGAVVGLAIWGPDFYAKEKAWLSNHRRTISQVVAAGMMVGACVVSGGGAAFVGMGFGIPMVVGGWQEDIQVNKSKDQVNDYLHNFEINIEQQRLLGIKMQMAFQEEVAANLQSELTNRRLNLGLYKNFFNTMVERAVCREMVDVGLQQAQKIKGIDKHSCLFSPGSFPSSLPACVCVGDAGQLYNYKTDWLDLNPSLGLALYEPGRGCFAQEIAQIPDVMNTKTNTSRFWFLQSLVKDFANLKPTDTITFEIRLKPIYLLDTFYIGIGIGGRPTDFYEIQEKGLADIERYNNAKMIVFKKETDTQKIGIYEHTANIKPDGWLHETSLAQPLELGEWYRIKGVLTGKSLTVTATSEGPNKTETKSLLNIGTVTVTPLPTKFKQIDCFHIEQQAQEKAITSVPLSVIYSGASIEFEIITPEETFSEIVYSKPGKEQTETERQKSEIEHYASLKTATFTQQDKKINLQAASGLDLLKGIYIYKTQDTLDKTQDPTIDDYVVFATKQTQDPMTIGNLGVTSQFDSLYNKEPILVSLVTGRTYEATGNQGYVADAWQTYQSTDAGVKIKATSAEISYGTFGELISTSSENAISLARDRYADKTGALTNTHTWHNKFILSPAGETADESIINIAAGRFIYTATINNKKNYVICAQFENNQIKEFGFPFNTKNAQFNALISLINSRVYTANDDPQSSSGTTVPGWDKPDSALEKYQKTHPGMSAALYKRILAKRATEEIKAATETCLFGSFTLTPLALDPEKKIYLFTATIDKSMQTVAFGSTYKSFYTGGSLGKNQTCPNQQDWESTILVSIANGKIYKQDGSDATIKNSGDLRRDLKNIKESIGKLPTREPAESVAPSLQDKKTAIPQQVGTTTSLMQKQKEARIHIIASLEPK